jgi:hypothetical protein
VSSVTKSDWLRDYGIIVKVLDRRSELLRVTVNDCHPGGLSLFKVQRRAFRNFSARYVIKEIPKCCQIRFSDSVGYRLNKNSTMFMSDRGFAQELHHSLIFLRIEITSRSIQKGWFGWACSAFSTRSCWRTE